MMTVRWGWQALDLTRQSKSTGFDFPAPPPLRSEIMLLPLDVNFMTANIGSVTGESNFGVCWI